MPGNIMLARFVSSVGVLRTPAVTIKTKRRSLMEWAKKESVNRPEIGKSSISGRL